jgi:hypothetical protein
MQRLSFVAAYSWSAMCVTLSLVDEEKRSTEIGNHTTDHQSDALVRDVFLSISFQLDWKEETRVADIPGRAHSRRYCRRRRRPKF